MILVALVERLSVIFLLDADRIYSAIAFGANGTYFAFQSKYVASAEVTIDIQLMFIGVVNKVLDYLLENTYGQLAMNMLTLWMVQYPSRRHQGGVDVIDFELKDELLKPWVAIANFIYRRQHHGYKGRGGWRHAPVPRFLICLVSSICFLLIGAAMNTVGIPKGR